ncbi:MAG: protein DA1 [bacterium]|nr:protein DA1 [bacterium]
MSCKHCGKSITGEYVKAEGYAFHPGCFVCGKCDKTISGSYQKVGRKFYHPVCYKEKTGLVCRKCGNVLDDTWVEHKGKKYHSQCLQLRCDICGKAITGEYSYDKNGKYHKNCFLNHKSPRCDVCDSPIVGKYMIDSWGHKAHFNHNREKTTICEYCARIISYSTSNGGYNYSDGRVVCGICKLTAVEEERRIRQSLLRVSVLLAAQPAGLDGIPGDIPIQLVDRYTLKRLGGSHLPGNGQGLTLSNITLEDKKRVKVEYHIYILSGIPQLNFDAVLAHELLHVWLIERDIKLSQKEAEGFCNLGSALVYQADDSKFARVLLERMESSPDRMYGKGYRQMKDRLRRLGWKRLKESL